MKGRIYQSFVRSAMLYASETWYLRENKIAILRRTEKVMTRAMCRVKLIDKRKSQELTSLLGLKYTLNELFWASGLRWYGHVLGRDNGEMLTRVRNFEVTRKKGLKRPNITWKRQVEEHIDKIGLKRKMSLTQQSSAMVFTNYLETRGESGHLFNKDKTGFKIIDLSCNQLLN